MSFNLGSVFPNFLHSIFPEYCCACDHSLLEGEQLICSECNLNLPLTDHSHNTENDLWVRLITRMPVSNALSYMKYNKMGIAQNIVHRFKYQKKEEIGTFIGKAFGQQLLENYKNRFDLIIPVPLHPNKLKKRGFNQSEVIAKGLSEVLNVALEKNIVFRVHENNTQANMDRLDRIQNSTNIFEAKNLELLENKHVLLVDDIITTGNTIENVFESIKDSNFKYFSVATMAHAI